MAFESGQMGRKRPGRMKVSMFAKLMGTRKKITGTPSKTKSHNVKGGTKKGPKRMSAGEYNRKADPLNIIHAKLAKAHITEQSGKAKKTKKRGKK